MSESTESDEPLPEDLPRWAVVTAISIGVLFLILAWLAVYFPHRRLELDQNTCCCCTTRKITDADQTPIGIALLTAGAGFILFGLNGLRLTKLSLGGASAEAARRRQATASAEEVQSMSPPAGGAALGAGLHAAAPLGNFADFSPEAKKVLATLARYQRNHDATNANRWGFAVGPGASDHREFLLGVGFLYSHGLIAIDLRGLVYLNNDGVQFVQNNHAAIDAYPAYYQNFRPA